MIAFVFSNNEKYENLLINQGIVIRVNIPKEELKKYRCFSFTEIRKVKTIVIRLEEPIQLGKIENKEDLFLKTIIKVYFEKDLEGYES